MEDHTNFVLIWCPYPDSSVGKESACSAGDPGMIPDSGRSPEEGIGYPLQYSGLENSMDCIVHGVAKSPTRLSDFHFTIHVIPLKYRLLASTLEKESMWSSTRILNFVSVNCLTDTKLNLPLLRVERKIR